MLFEKQVKAGDLLRSKITREVFLVVSKSAQGLFVVNLMIKNNNPALVQIILPGYNDSWERDIDIDDLEEWEAEMIKAKLPIIEEVQNAVIK